LALPGRRNEKAYPGQPPDGYLETALSLAAAQLFAPPRWHSTGNSSAQRKYIMAAFKKETKDCKTIVWQGSILILLTLYTA